MTKKRMGVLIVLALMIVGYSVYLMYIASPYHITIERLIDKNLDVLSKSEEVLIKGEITFPLKVNELEYNRMHYYVNVLYQKNTKNITVIMSPDESFKTNIIELAFSNGEVSMFLNMAEGQEKELVFSEKMDQSVELNIEKTIKDMFKDSEKTSFKKQGVNIIENGKKIKKWGYVLSDSFSTQILLEKTNKDFLDLQSDEIQSFLSEIEAYLEEGEVKYTIHTDDSQDLRAVIFTFIHPNLYEPIEILFVFEFLQNEVIE